MNKLIKINPLFQGGTTITVIAKAMPWLVEEKN
jgi:hypothetical protein